MKASWVTVLLLSLAVAGLPSGASAGSFDWDRIVGEWEVVADNNPDSTVETVVVEVSISATDTQGRNIYEGVVANAGYHECLSAGQVVWPALEQGRSNGEYLTDDGLSAFCGDEGGRLSVVGDFDMLAYDSNGPGGQWRLSPGSGNVLDPDDIVGFWDDATSPGGASPVARVEVTGSAPTYIGTVVEASGGSCYSVGQVIWPAISFGRGGNGATFGITDAIGGLDCTPIETAELRLDRTNEPQRLRIVGSGLPGFQLDRVDVEAPEETGEEPPNEIQRIAPFSIRGRWIDISFSPDSPDNDSMYGRVDVSLEEADSAVIATGVVATSRNVDSCPGEGAIAWQITGERSDGYVGTANVFARTAVGCERIAIEDMRITSGAGPGQDADGVTLQVGGRPPALYARQGLTSLVSAAREQSDVALDFFIWGVRRALVEQASRFAQVQPVTLFLATEASFPDGLAVSSVTGALRGVTLLLDPQDQAGNTAVVEEALRLLSDAGISVAELVVAGGEAAVPTTALPTSADLPPVRRIQGPNRFATAVALSQSVFSGPASTVYIATGANFPDALAGGAAASVAQAPLLLVDGGRLPEETAAELTRLSPDRIVVLGGTAVIPEAMVTQLASFAGQVDRLSGDSRFATAAAIAADSFPSGAEVVLLVPGGSFQEALVAGSAAWLFDAPLLLLDGNGVPAPLADALASLGASRGFLLAAEDRIPAAVVTAVQDLVSGPA